MRLLQEPSTVRRPNESRGLGSWWGPVPRSAPQGPVALVVFATWASAILICLRMYARSAGVTVKPWPTGAAWAGVGSWNRAAARTALSAAVPVDLRRRACRLESISELLGGGGSGRFAASPTHGANPTFGRPLGALTSG